MAQDQGPVVQSALLRGELVRLRKEKNLTQEQVARNLDWSPSKLIRIEGGKSSVTKTDLQALLRQYGVTSESRQSRLEALAASARDRNKAWWNTYRGDIEENYLAYVGYEAGASFIRQSQSTVIPGLLQSLEYAQVIVSMAPGGPERMRAADLRIVRQQEMAKREEQPWRFYIIDEAVIRRHVGVKQDRMIMPTQLRRVADAAEASDRLTVRVLPFSKGAHRGMYGPFTLLEFDGPLADVLYLEGGSAPNLTVVGEDPRIIEYREMFEILLEDALSEEQSIALMRQVAQEMAS
jgi:transcriptional regulator with XRE-family HTH domain